MEPASQKGDKASSSRRHSLCQANVNEVKVVQSIQRNQFDPRHPAHRVLDQDQMNQLLKRVQTSIPGTGLQQFWKMRSSDKGTSDNDF